MKYLLPTFARCTVCAQCAHVHYSTTTQHASVGGMGIETISKRAREGSAEGEMGFNLKTSS